MSDPHYVAFISYAHRYRSWVEALHRNLELALKHFGNPARIFLDTVDLGSGRSWVRQLQAGLDEAEHLVLVATPEAVASPRVADEWEAIIATRRDWDAGHFHLVRLVDGPLPPFLEKIQYLDFREYEGAHHEGFQISASLSTKPGSSGSPVTDVGWSRISTSAPGR